MQIISTENITQADQEIKKFKEFIKENQNIVFQYS
jgi:hypothetical protein